MIENVNPYEVRKELITLLNLKNDIGLYAIVETIRVRLRDTGAYLYFKGTNYFEFAFLNKNRVLIESMNAQFYPNVCGLAFKLTIRNALKTNPMDLEIEMRRELEINLSNALRTELLRALGIS